MLIHDEGPPENETNLPTPETKLTEEEKKMLTPEKEQPQVEIAPMTTSPAAGLPPGLDRPRHLGPAEELRHPDVLPAGLPSEKIGAREQSRFPS